MQLKDISIKTFSNREIIKNFNLNIRKNDKIALIGEEGNGKSTLLKYIYNPKLIEKYCFYSGERIALGNIGYLPQFIDEYYLPLSVEEFLLKKDIDKEDNYELFSNLYKLEKLFIKYRLKYSLFENNNIISTLSGGEKIKLELIKLELYEPDLILLDEPTNDLDIESIEILENFIINTDIPLIFISHDVSLLSKCANRIVHLEQINHKSLMRWNLENVCYDEYVSLREIKFKKQDEEAYRSQKEYKEMKEILTRQHAQVESDLNNAVRCPIQGRLLAKKMKNILSQEKKLDKMEVTSYSQKEEAINIFFDEYEDLPKNKIILSLENYKLQINSLILSNNISLLVKAREKITIIGNNGIGKSTLIKRIYDILKDNKSISLGYMPQNYEEELSSFDTCLSYLQSFIGYGKEEKIRIMSCLGALNFVEKEMNSPLKEISGGQKAKLFFLKLILMKNNVLILDEPTRNLSPLSIPEILKILSSFKGCIIAVSHDRNYINQISTSIYELTKDGLIKIDD